MVVLQNIVLKKKLTLISFLHFSKKSIAFKVLFKLKNPFCLSDFAEHLEKPFILQNNHEYGSVSNLRFATIAKNLKIIFFSVFPSIFKHERSQVQ